MDFNQSLSEWAKDKPLSILQLDPADRAVLKIADERDAIQKKTFTKWVNKHLKKHWRYVETYTCLHVCYSCRACSTSGGNRHIDDLFEDIRDGHNLISLLEVLAAEILPREKGRLRFHMLQNVHTVLDFLKFKKIKLVNIRPEDIVDGNPKLTLGLIWTIILHFQLYAGHSLAAELRMLACYFKRYFCGKLKSFKHLTESQQIEILQAFGEISDIITGLSDESVTAREALLRWAQRTTERYPGVRVVDFTNSWKDGLAFNAILHRNRPDLLDFRSLRTRSARDNLDTAFSLAEKEFGITRLLDPEDVDTPEPDEKSIITYISSVYDVFPDPPAFHPLINDEKRQKVEEYKELTISLQMWMQESLATLRSRNYPNTVAEMKVLLNERSRFRSEDISKHLKEKHKLSQLHSEIQKLAKETGKVTFEGDLSLDSVEKRWNQLLAAYQESETSIREEISHLEKLQKIADKINREAKMCDVKLDDIEKKIFEEEKRIQRLYTVDAKYNCDQIEGSLKSIEESLRAMKKDVKILAEGRYYQTIDIDKRIHTIFDRYSNIRSLFQTQLLLPLSTKPVKIEEKKTVKQRVVNNEQKGVDSSKTFNILKEHIEWVEKKNKRVHDIYPGSDLQSIKSAFEQHKNEHKSIESYKRKIDQCSLHKSKYTGEDLISFSELLNQLEKAYSELLAFSSTKLNEIETLMDFVQSASKELKWISEKEEIEVSRDWNAKSLNLVELEHYQEVLTSELEKREMQLNAIQNKGESLLLQKHSNSKPIEDYISLLQSQWSWLLQLTLCLETHLKHAKSYHQFFKEARECEQLLKKVEERLQTSFSRMPVSVDEGEKTLKQIHHLREELSGYSDIILSVIKQSFTIVPLKQRRLSILKPINIVAICKYKQSNVCISKDEQYILLDNSHRTKWKISSSNIKDAVVPSVCFVIPPVNNEAVEIGESLKKKYDAIIALWTSKEQKLRQNLIIATIRVVKSWDITQFRNMETSQRESIISALNDDTQKLLTEGSGDESTLQKLKQEMEHCNQLYTSLVEKMSLDESQKSSKISGKKILDEISSAQSELSDKEKLLKAKLHEQITWNLDALENFVIEHKEFELSLRAFEEKLQEIKQIYSSLTKKSTTCQTKFDALLSTWDKLWELSNLYVERLKALEICLHAFTEATQVVSNFEVQLASFDNMPSDMDNLKRVYERLMCLQTEMQQHQGTIDAVSESVRNVKNLIHRTRPKQVIHSDLKKFENDVKKLTVRWENVSSQLVERLRSCSAASELLRTYRNKVEEDNVWTSETTIKVNNLKTVKTMTTKEVEMQVEPVMNLYSSIAEHNSSFELTNILGARYIREAKIYDLRLKHYKENLEEEHPSLDASLLKRAKLMCGADTIAYELDCLNQTYERLMGKVLEYLEELKASFSMHNQHKLCNIISKAAPPSLETFRTVIDQAPALNLMEVDHYSLAVTEEKAFITQDMKPTLLPESKKEEMCYEDVGSFNSNQIKDFNYSAQTNQRSKTETSLNFQPHSIPFDSAQENICTVKGILNLKTQEMVTLKTAVDQEIINLQNEEFTDLRTGSKITISDALNKGYIDHNFFSRLSSKCGIFYPGTKEELSLLQAVQKNLYDPNSAMLVNPLEETNITLTDAFHVGIIKKMGMKTLIQMGFIKASNLTISEAVQKEFLDPNTGIFHDPLTNLSMNFSEAINEGFISVSGVEDLETGMTLAEAVDRNLINNDTRQFIDEDSGEQFNIEQAISNGLLNSNTKEVVNLETSEVCSIEDAILYGILDVDTCKYIDKKLNLQLSFQEARQKQLIFRPLTLNEALEKNIIDDCGLVVSPFKNEKLSIINAIAKGILDSESKCIVHPQSYELLSLPEAMKQGILSPLGTFWDPEKNKELSLHEAKESGFITSVYYKNVFDIECVKNMKTGELLSFKEAISKEIINIQKDEYIDNSSLKKMNLKDAVSEQYIQDQIFKMLSKSIGVKSTNAGELSLLECVKEDIIDLKTGHFKDPLTKQTLFLKEAIQKQIITPEGASILKGLFNIKMTTASITKFVSTQDSSQNSDNVNTSENHSETESLSSIYKPLQLDCSIESEKCKLENIVRNNSMHSAVTCLDISDNDNLNESILSLHQLQLNMKEKYDQPDIQQSEISEQLALLHAEENIECEDVLQRKQNKSSNIVDLCNFHLKDDKSIHAQILQGHQTTKWPSELHSQHILSSTVLKQEDESTVSLPEDVNMHGKQSYTKSNNVVSTVKNSGERYYSEESSPCVHVLELPPNGWYLKEAIAQSLFDAESGLFTVPGTDRLVSFEETLKMGIVNPNSARVLETKSNNFISISHALNNGILSSMGHYTDTINNLNITMKEAIEKQMVILEDRISTDSTSVKSTTMLQFSKLEGQSTIVKDVSSTFGEENVSVRMQLQNKINTISLKDLNTTLTTSGCFEILPGVFYNPEDFMILYTATGEKVQLLHSLLTENNISSLFGVQDLSSQKFVTFQDAIQSKLIDPDTGDYCSPQLKCRIPFKEAVHNSYIAMVDLSNIESNIVDNKACDIHKTKTDVHVLKLANENYNDSVSNFEVPADVCSSKSSGKKRPETYEIPEVIQKTNLFNNLTLEQLASESRTSQELSVEKVDASIPSTREAQIDHAYSQQKDSNSNSKISNIPTFIPKSSVDIKNFSVLSDKVVLYKIPRIIVPLQQGIKMGLIDEKTADVITNVVKTKNNEDEYLRLRDALDKKLLNGNAGEIVDFHNFEKISINEAINRGLLDANNGKLLIPVGHSLTISEAYEQGLIDVSSQFIIHPENGTLLSLHDAILCDIIDPMSLVVDPQTQCVKSLKECISDGIVNATKNIVNGPNRNWTLSEAAKTNSIFKSSMQHKCIPPLALTFPVALQHNSINISKREFIHPVTKQKYNINEAIDNHMIMVIPRQKLPNSVLLDDALDKNLIDPLQNTFKHPTTEELFPVHEAVNEGILFIESKTIPCHLLETSPKLSSMKQKIALTTASCNIPLKVLDTTDNAHETVEVQTGKGNIDACTNNISEKTRISSDLKSMEPVDDSAKINKDTSLEDACLTVYEVEKDNLADPAIQKNIAFNDLIENGNFDENTVIYDEKTRATLTLKEALKANVIDRETGRYIDKSTGQRLTMKEALQMGLLTILGAPLIAGAAVVSAVKLVVEKNITDNSSLAVDPIKDSHHAMVEQCCTIPDNRVIDDITVEPVVGSLIGEPIQTNALHINKVHEPTNIESSVSQHLNSSMISMDSSHTKDLSLPYTETERMELDGKEIDLTKNKRGTEEWEKIEVIVPEKKENQKSQLYMDQNTQNKISTTQTIKPFVDLVKSNNLSKTPSDIPFKNINITSSSISITSSDEQKINVGLNQTEKLVVEGRIKPTEFQEIIHKSNETISTICPSETDVQKLISSSSLEAAMQAQTNSYTQDERSFVMPNQQEIDNSTFNLDVVSSDSVAGSQKHFSDSETERLPTKLFELNSNTLSDSAIEKQLESILDEKSVNASLVIESKLTDLSTSVETSLKQVPSMTDQPFKLSKSLPSDAESAPVFSEISYLEDAKVACISKEVFTHTDVEKDELSLTLTMHDFHDVSLGDIHTEASTISHLEKSSPSGFNVDGISMNFITETSRKSENVCDLISHVSSDLPGEGKSKNVETRESIKKSLNNLVFTTCHGENFVKPNVIGSINSSHGENDSLYPEVKESLPSKPAISPLKDNLESPTKATMDSLLTKQVHIPSEGNIENSKNSPGLSTLRLSYSECENSKWDTTHELIAEKDEYTNVNKLISNRTLPVTVTGIESPATEPASSKSLEIATDSRHTDKNEPIDEDVVKSLNFINSPGLPILDKLQSPMKEEVHHTCPGSNSFLSQATIVNTGLNGSNTPVSIQSQQDFLHEETFPNTLESNDKKSDSTKMPNEIILPIENKDILVDNDSTCATSNIPLNFNAPISLYTKPSTYTDSNQCAVFTQTDIKSSIDMVCASTTQKYSISIQELYAEKERDTVVPCLEVSGINFNTVNLDQCHIKVGRETLPLKQALEKGLIKQESVIKFQNNNEVLLVDECNESLKHEPSGELSTNEIQENYKTCKENTSNLLLWMAEIETRLSNLGLVKEDISSLQHQISSAKVLKDDLENQQHLVNTCLDQLRQLIQKGLEILSKEEIHELQRDLQSVKRRYDILINECDRLLRRLVAALEELQKFKSELGAFREWLNCAEKDYKEKEKRLGHLKKLTENYEIYRVFASDVIAHQADLRFIAMAAQKFLDESKDYLKTLNMLRVNLSKSSPNLEPLESEVKMQVQEVSALFHNLLNSVNKLSDHYVIVHNKHRYYIESFEKANSWFRDAKSSGEKLLKEPVSAEPSAVQEQLDFIKTLNMEVVGQGRLIENSIQSAKALTDCLENLEVTSTETENVQVIVSGLQKDYRSFVNTITLKIKELQTALIHSQDVQDGLDRLLRWLDETESSMRNQSKPVSLVVEKLDEQVQEFKILQSDVNNQKQSIDTIDIPCKELMNSNPKSAKTVDSKLKDIISRYDRVCERLNKREQFLEEISASVRMFEAMSNQFEEWTTSMQDRIESHDVSQQLDVDGFASVIEYTMNQRNAKQNEYEDMIKIGKNLITKRDVTDSLQVKEKIKNLEHMWKSLGAVLNEKQSLGKARSEQLAAYEVMRGKVIEWISKMETVVDNSDPISLDQIILKKQLAEIKPLLKEHSDYSSTIEKLNNLGHNYDLMIKGESPRRKAGSPVKKQSSPTRKSPSKSKSPDSTPTSPVKNQLSTQSPLSTVSSGFSSRRSSTDNFSGIEEHNPIQLQLSEINHRYSLLGAKLSDRSQEISQINDELKSYTEVIKTIKVFLEAKEKLLPKESLPSCKEEAEKYSKTLKTIQDEMIEKQSEMDNFRMRAKEILHSKIDVKGASELQCQVTELEEKWSKLWMSIKKQILFLQDLKDFQDAQVLLNSWLSQREKMFLVLGPIASEPRMVSSQVQQVQVMKDEFSSQKSLLDRLNHSGTAIIQHLESINANTKKVTEQMENIHHVWADLVGRLEERDKNLEAACGVAKDFYKNHSQIQEKLQKISDSFDQLSESSSSVEEQLKKLVGLEEQLEKQRPLLTDIDSICDQLCDILNDTASKNDIRNKINSLEKTYANLYKKINNKKAELESCLKEDEGFYKSCSDVQTWLDKTDTLFASEVKFSADVNKLKILAQDYEPTYKAVMDKEHELHLLISKGTDMVGKVLVKQEQKNLKTKLDAIQKQWNKLKKTAIDRRTQIHCCLDNCQKYHDTTEAFIPWLEASEKKLMSFKPISLQRTILSKQIKEMQAFKNDLTKHIQEFESLRQLGDILITCVIDKDLVRTQIDQLKKRWEELNQNISIKIQTFEDLSMKIIEYKEKLRDVQHSVQRLEDKLSSHDALGNVSRDPILLNRLKSLYKEATSLEKNLILVKDFSQIVISKAGSSVDASEILKDVENIENKLHTLISTLDERCSNLATATKIISTFTTQVKSVVSEIESLSDVFDRMSPLARDKNSLQQQMIEIKEFVTRLTKIKESLQVAESQCNSIISEGYIAEPKSFKEQVSGLQKQVIRFEEHIKARESSIESILSKLERFYTSYSETRKELETIIKEEKVFQFIGGDVDSIRTQQQKFKIFRNEKIQPLCKLLEECNKMGQGIIQSAAPGVNTNALEQDLENLNESWNSLQERINEREKKLDVALVQSGKFQEALTGVQKWLKDTEEMVTNQKAPSADFKVVKAQVQEQKFLKKMLLDRQNSVMSIKVMGAEFMQSTVTKKEQEQVDSQMSTIIERFDELRVSAEGRMSLLEKTVPGAQELQTILSPLSEWLEQVDKKLATMSTIPVETELVKKKITEHKKIHEDIVSHKKQVEKLKEVSEKLKKMIGKDDAQSLEQKVKIVTSRFSEIVETSSSLSKELASAEKGIAVFMEKYEKTVSWVEKTIVHVSSFQVFSVYFDKLQDQVKSLKKIKDNITKEQISIESVLTSGQDIMKHASGEDTIQMKEKLDTLGIKFADLNNRVNERFNIAKDSLPLVQSFYDANSKISTWLDSAEKSMKNLDSVGLNVQQTTIHQLQSKIQEFRSILETLNHTGPRICQLSPGEGSTTIENIMSKANHRFEAISESVQRKAERIELAVQRKFDVVGDIEELLDWFKDIANQVNNADGLSPEPTSLSALLKQQKAVSDEVNSQKARVRDILTSAKKLMRESSSEDLSFIREKAESLKTISNDISSVCQDRLSIIEQALPLAEHFFETHTDLGQWLEVAEGEAELLEAPALNVVQIKKQQDRNMGLVQSVHEHKPLVDKLNKTGSALTKLCKDEETEKVEVILESDNSRYNALRQILREHQNALEEALQATAQFSDKLEGMLSALTSTADQIQNAEPISAHPERIQEQINDNKAVLQDLEKRTSALEAVKKAADDVIIKASSIDEPAVRDIKKKLDRLNDLWETIQTSARNRGKSLEEALVAAEKFWDELTAVMKALKELQDNLNNQESPAVEPSAVQQQQEVLQEIKQDITQAKPEVDHCRQAGQDLMQLCGEPDKPEVKKHIEDLDSVWENVTTLYAKREQNLIDAMEKAMNFHDTLQNLLEFLDAAEYKFSNLGAVSADIDAVKKQILQLQEFKISVDPHMVEIESLNRQAQELVERTSPDQSLAIREPLDDINKRWDDLLKGIVDRQQEMENALLKLGQFQHALDELIVWMSKTENALDDLKPVFGDPQVIEVVLAKHKVLTNDIQAHEVSIETINSAGRQLIERDESEDAKSTQNKLSSLNVRWKQLQEKSSQRQRELEEALKEALQFHQEIQDLLMWLSDIDGHLVTSKPVGGLPETAREQLNRFMDLYSELDGNRHKVENVLQQGQNYLKRSGESSTKKLQHSLQTLRQRWENVLNKANDRKIKLEIALREATEFHEALQSFVEWLTNAEKYLTGLKPVSRYMNTVLEQIEDHRNFQKDIGAHREVMLNLDKKGTHLKYFSQKQDVILIKNLLISVQHRWERIVSKAAERTRSLDHGYKEAKEFHDAWTSLSTWLDEAEKTLDSITHIGNDPVKIKQLLAKHKEFQRVLGSKQTSFDTTMRIGRALKDRCPKQDVSVLQEMMDGLKSRWNRVCSKSVDRQRKLEEALLYSGQFKEAVQALMDWLDKSLLKLSDAKLYHGDLDTVTALVEKHKTFEDELKNRGRSLETIRKTAKDLKESANPEDAQRILTEVEKLEVKWKQISEMSESYKYKLDEALKQAESLHKNVHMLLEWLSDAEMKLRFVGPLPEDEETTKKQIATHQEFLNEMEKQEVNKNSILEIAQEILKKCHPDGISVIRHWITIIQSRWEEISIWARQRDQRLKDHLKSLKDIMELLEELLRWLTNAETTLTTLEAEPLPDDLPTLERLIKEHQVFMDDISKKQPDVEKVSKAFSSKREVGKVLPQVSTKDKNAKDRTVRGATPSPIKTSTPLKSQGDSDIKHPKVRLLLDKWRTVWVLAMERQRRLQDKYNYLKELERIKNFDFNEWRRRYLGWMNNKKSRIMDQFRKIDKNNDGKVTKQEFIDGILRSKFTTSRLEMERVADIFDINGDGFIDTKEYIDTLRPDRETGPQTDAEKIQDEVQRQVAKCTCVHRFKVYQVGEGKYRFGDSQKLRLVRILRSTVMVRVGGGWVALDEFLVKNDPCRAKGRTNLELREQFILAEGVSQSMAPFKPKPSPNSSVSSQSGASFSRSGNSIPSAGPITKIREKSERSTPMHQGRSSVDTSSDISGPSFSEMDNSSNRSGLSRVSPSASRLSPRTLGSKPSSRPSSRQGSRPSSRAPSDLSQDGVDDYKKGRKQIGNQQNSALGVKNSASALKSASGTIGSKIPSVKKTTPKSSVIPANHEKSKKEAKK